MLKLETRKAIFKLLSCLFIVGFELQSFAGTILTEDEIKVEVQKMIEMRHPIENKFWWRSLGSHAAQVIMSMYLEINNIYYKLRLLDSLAWFNNEKVLEFLKHEIDTNPNQVIRESGVQALILNQGVKEESYINGILNGKNLNLKIAMARALISLNNIQANKIVNAYLKAENNHWAIEKIKHYQKLGLVSKSCCSQNSQKIVKKPPRELF